MSNNVSLDIGTSAMRSGTLGSDPAVSQMVANTSNLLKDLQAIGTMHEQIARVAASAASTASNIVGDPNNSFITLANSMKELICSYVYTYDHNLSPKSEIAPVKTFSQIVSGWEKDPSKLIAPVTTPITLPAMPGSLFYLATNDDMQNFNPDLYTAYQTAKTANSSWDDSQLVSSLLPQYGITGWGSLPSDLQGRWTALMNLTATMPWTMTDGTIINGITESDEVIAIAGLRDDTDYKLWVLIRELDAQLDSLTTLEAQQLISLFQQLGEDPNHEALFLANGKVLNSPQSNFSALLVRYLGDKRTGASYSSLFNWFSTTPVTAALPSSANLPTSSRLYTIATQSTNYVNNNLATLMSGFGIISTDSDTTRNTKVLNQFSIWRSTFRSVGGILGFEGVALLAALTALERCKSAAFQGLGDTSLISYAQEGLRLAKYISNAGPLQDAFNQLITK